MNSIFLGEPVQEIKNWFVETFPSWPAYTTLKFVDGTTQTKEIIGAATWKNIGVKTDQYNNDTTLQYCQLGKNVTEISSHAFRGCYYLTSISIPNSVSSIGIEAFTGCSFLSSVNIPNSVSSIGKNAFQNCRSLPSIDIPSSVSSIEYGAFVNCSSLTSINIPNSVTSIGYIAIAGCSSLTSINIPNSVSSIESTAFRNCSSLISIVFKDRTMSDITSMSGYPWDMDTSIIVPGIS